MSVNLTATNARELFTDGATTSPEGITVTLGEDGKADLIDLAVEAEAQEADIIDIADEADRADEADEQNTPDQERAEIADEAAGAAWVEAVEDTPRLIANEDPEAGRVWLENEEGKPVVELAVDILGPMEAMALADRLAKIGTNTNVVNHIATLDSLIDGEDADEDALAATLAPVRNFLNRLGDDEAELAAEVAELCEANRRAIAAATTARDEFVTLKARLPEPFASNVAAVVERLTEVIASPHNAAG